MNTLTTIKTYPTKQQFIEKNAWGLYCSLDLYNCNANYIRDKQKIEQYIIQLCDIIDMKRFGDPIIIHFGEDEKVAGFSMVQLIETSLISGHFANQTNNAYIDIFSCKFYDIQKVIAFTTEFFQSTRYIAQYNLRL